MGLDMYAGTLSKKPEKPVDFQVTDEMHGSGEYQNLHYWRKHPNLHGWMEQLYRQKGGTDQNFNVSLLELTKEDLDLLEADIKTDALPATTGFFFGRTDGSEVNDDLEFIRKAREQIAAGRSIVYYAWW